MEIINDKNSLAYIKATKKVKKLKGFYYHLSIYILVNLLIICIYFSELKNEDSIWSLEIWSTPLFWGIGLLAHAFSVFGHDYILGNNWEERKTKELMEKYK